MNTKTILVVEDNELNMKLVRNLLKIGGYRMLEAIDGETGLQLACTHRPDLILMDIQLPGMDGLSVTRVLKADPELQDIPVIALTSYAMRGDEEKSLKAGCAGYLTKPLNTRSFLEMLSRYLPHDDLDENPS